MSRLLLLSAYLTATCVFFAQATRSNALASTGFTLGYAVQESGTVCSVNQDLIQTPLFAPYNRDNMGFWYNAAEETAFANVAFIALNYRGDSPCGIVPPPGGEPTSYASNLVSAINQRGYQSFLKVALFDDTGSYIWHIRACQNNTQATFDLGNQTLWETYFWDTRWLKFFQLVPDANRVKIQGRPLVFLWNISHLQGFTNLQGHLTGLIEFLRNKCMTTFGFNPFIVVDWTWINEDPAVGAAVDGVDQWFATSPGANWSKYTHQGASGTFTTGVVNPGFWNPRLNQFTDRANGSALRNGLANALSGNGDLLLMENLTDVEENAGYYRGAILCNPSCGGPTPPAGQCWPYANLYLNIVREEVNPFQKFVQLQAEAADTYQVQSTSSGIFRRDGTLNISYTDATHSNWAVTLKAPDWLQYNSFQLGASSSYLLTIVYTSSSGASGQLLVDGVPVSSFSLPATGRFTAVNAPGRFVVASGNHDIRLQILSGAANIDFWQLNGF
ncbi:MAG TPA: DUF5010 domain-containing protein [Thermoanaerobaculia bacterium]|nr:DUF5010 domain-containing protein [Thermoanaerobaculia bacterium]